MTTPANLVIRPEKLGDLIVATPVFRAFKETFPDQPLHLLTDELYADAVRHDPHLDKIITIRWKGRRRGERDSWPSIYRKLKPHAYARAAILYYNVECFNWLTAALRIPQVAQLGGTLSAPLLGHRTILRKMFQERNHYAEWYLQVAAALGAVTARREPAVYVLPEEARALTDRFPFLSDKRRRILVHPFGHGSSPNFSLPAYARLIGDLSRECDAEIFVTGTPLEKKLWEPHRSTPARLDWLGSLSLREWMVAASLADVVVAGSTGVIHAAAALGTPTIGLYCPYIGSHPDVWGPLGPRVHALTAPENSCRKIQPCDSRCTGDNLCDLSFAIRNSQIIFETNRFLPPI